MSMAKARALWFLLLIFSLPTALLAENAQQQSQELAMLKEEVARLRLRIEQLEERVMAYEKEAKARSETKELEELLRAAETAAQTEPEREKPPTKVFRGGQRALQALNPNITLTGDVFGSLTDAPNTAESELRDEVQAREFELGLESMLDPFTRFKAFVSIEDVETVELEEGYMEWLKLPLRSRFKVGRFFQQLGELNRWHTHALPQVDRPLAITTLFGEEGLRATGFALNWVIPSLWATANELTVEITNSENEIAFAGDEFDDFAFLAFFKNFWEISPSSYFEMGLSGIHGANEPTGSRATSIFGAHLAFQWQPLQKGKYRSFLWRSEGFYSDREEMIEEIESISLYSYLEYQLARRWFLGLRYDYVEDPTDDSHTTWQLAPYLTFWQSEWVRLRAQYNHLERNWMGTGEDTFYLQFTWAAGPHKHERY